jgi:hypothetical protein
MKRNIYFIDSIIMVYLLVLNLFIEIICYNWTWYTFLPEIQNTEKIIRIYYYFILFYGLLRNVFGSILFIRNIKNITFKINYLLLMIPLMILSFYYIIMMIYIGKIIYLKLYIIEIIIILGGILWLFNWISVYKQNISKENNTIYKGYEYIYIGIYTLFFEEIINALNNLSYTIYNILK